MSKRRLALRTAQAFLTMLGATESVALLWTMNTWMMCTALGIAAVAYACLFRLFSAMVKP